MCFWEISSYCQTSNYQWMIALSQKKVLIQSLVNSLRTSYPFWLVPSLVFFYLQNVFRSLRHNCGLTNHIKLPKLQAFLLPNICPLQPLWHSNCKWNLAVSVQDRNCIHPSSWVPAKTPPPLMERPNPQCPRVQCLTAWDPDKKWGCWCSNIPFFA